jgi:dTDP-4-dehydrorhamnose reductase
VSSRAKSRDRHDLAIPNLELWASPEPTFARIDDERVRDQSAETGLDARAEGDAERIAALGVTGSRVPVLWERVSPLDPHDRDYSEPQRRLDALRARGIDPIVTLLHHGSGPRFTDLLDPAFPLWFAEYAEATATAFPWVRRWTPINEPLTTARFATLYGVWYPNMRDDRAFGRAMVNQTLAQQAAMRRIRRVIPDAEFVLTDDLQRFTAGDEGVAEYVAFLRERVYLSAELVAGRVDDDHPLAAFLIGRCGVNALELGIMTRDACVPDLVAFNHYPHSERYVFSQAEAAGDVPAVYVMGEASPAIGPLLRAAAERLRLPLAVGEVHVHASAPERVRWLAQQAADVVAARDDGVDIRALGAWAAFGMVDWHSLLRETAGVAEDGVYTFAGAVGTPEPTLVADAIRELAATGRIDDRGVRGWWERDDRARPLAELCAMRDAGRPEGDHLRTSGAAIA